MVLLEIQQSRSTASILDVFSIHMQRRTFFSEMQNIGRASFPSNAIPKHINYSKPSLLVGNESFNIGILGCWLLKVFLLSPLIQKYKSYQATNLLKVFICIILSSMAYVRTCIEIYTGSATFVTKQFCKIQRCTYLILNLARECVWNISAYYQ